LSIIDPDLVFTHYRDDRHQDHRLISDLTWNTFRNHLILEYEIPKYDGDLGAPNFFVPLEKSACSRKIQILVDSFKSQSQKQ
jgi:LmbE family N-acetylglucosaminyl deacetylase